MMRIESAWDTDAELYNTKQELDELRLAARRYEIARRLNPREWAAVWAENIQTGKPFDEIIDGRG